VLKWHYNLTDYHDNFQAQVKAKIIIEKWEVQHDVQHSEVKYEIKDATSMSIDTVSLADADDVTVSHQSF
jgi:hypothetical protein